MKSAESHAILYELGANEKDDCVLERRLLKQLASSDMADRAVLIGGPPCQAYSVVGRSRNMGTKGYIASDDHRHFLYREYLRILNIVKPAVFVMENVPGILSSKINGDRIFPNILRDLAAPYKAMGKRSGKKYQIHSLVTDDSYVDGDDPALIDGRNFRIKAEDYGIPQKRHRVILLGLREDISTAPSKLIKSAETITVADVISDLPPLRSKLSKVPDSGCEWLAHIRKARGSLREILSNSSGHADLINCLNRDFSAVSATCPPPGSIRMKFPVGAQKALPSSLRKWYLDSSLEVVLNHETRGHIYGDLERYLFSSCFAQVYGRSPNANEYPKELTPKHKNWRSGKFADRFRTQVATAPATTVTSHISKDGNYFIHPSPAQCRSLTVREAARLQTFPDNYIFLGNRTEQYVQVGNAVPPLLAKQIAEIVFKIIC